MLEKGFNFLYYLETLLGGNDVFEPYLKAHVERFSHKSIDTNDFKSFLYEYFSGDSEKVTVLDSVDWNAWFHGVGMPPVV